MNPFGRGFHDAANWFFFVPLCCYFEKKRKMDLGNKIIKGKKKSLPEADWTFGADKCEDLICPC